MSLLLLLLEPRPTGQAIVNNANTTVGHTGASIYTIEKTSGAGGFNASAVSSVGLTGDFVLRIKLVTLLGGLFIGMNSDPLTDNDYTSIDYAWGFGSGSVTESGAILSSPGPNGTYFWIWRAGTTLGYGRGNDLTAAQASPDRTVTTSATLYFDSSLNATGDKAEVLLYLPENIAGSSSLAFSTSATLTANAALSGASALTFSPAGILKGNGALAGASTLTFAPAGILVARGPLSGSSSLTFAPAGTLVGRGLLSGATTLTFSPAGALVGRGALVGASSLTFASAGVLGGNGTLSGASAVSFTATGSITAFGELSGSTSLTFSLTATLDVPSAFGDLAGSTSLTFSAAGNVVAIAPLSGSASFALSVSGALGSQGRLDGSASFSISASGTISFISNWRPETAPDGVSITIASQPGAVTVTRSATPPEVTIVSPTPPGSGAFTQDNSPAPIEMEA